MSLFFKVAEVVAAVLNDEDDLAVVPAAPVEPIAAPQGLGLVNIALRTGPPRGARTFRFPLDPAAREAGRPHLENCDCSDWKAALEIDWADRDAGSELTSDSETGSVHLYESHWFA